jgi:hypothetical protein
MSPEDRMKVNRSARDWTTLSPDRQAVMKSAFGDVRTQLAEMWPTADFDRIHESILNTRDRGIRSKADGVSSELARLLHRCMGLSPHA